MGRPARLDSPKKITLSLSKVCHEQARELADLMSSEPGRRTTVSFSEIVERAVAAMHLATIHPRSKRKK
jgi:hypothetical protein